MIQRRASPGKHQEGLGRVQRLVADDLPGHRLEEVENGTARFKAVNGGLDMLVDVKVERRFLGRTEVAVFRAEIPDSSGESAQLQVRHTGRVTRTGIEVKGADGGRLLDSLADDAGFVGALISLDFKRFSLVSDGETLIPEVELMGAAHVAVAFPPMRSWVRLYPDQRDALIRAFEELARVASRSGRK